MAANGYDATDGSPLFSDSDAPDIKVDPRAAAIYAAEVGNRIVKANLAALEAYAYSRAGLRGHALDTKSEYEHDGSGWKLVSRPWTTFTPTITGLTVNGSITQSKYKVERGVIRVKLRIPVASLTTTPVVNLPITAGDSLEELLMSEVHYRPNAGSVSVGHALKISATQVQLMTEGIVGSSVYLGGLSATVPITFGPNNSVITAVFDYEVA